MGDPSGIGPEVTAKALLNSKISRLANFVVVGDSFVLSKYFPKKKSFPSVVVADADNVNRKKFRLGVTDACYGRAAIEYIDIALTMLKEGYVDALVTAPVSKESIKLSGLKSFQGHTEYLAQKTKTKKIMMMLLADNFRVSLVTRHIPINKISEAITKKKVYETLIQTYLCLKSYFKIENPKIGVCGLNPHAGEGGLLGCEEQQVVIPAIKRARSKCSNISDPLPADTMFVSSRRAQLDAIVAMYHDQGLIPLKTIGFSNSVNLSFGLPFIRTSPAHGTGFNIAGKGAAEPTSMIEAIKLACKLYKNSR